MGRSRNNSRQLTLPLPPAPAPPEPNRDELLAAYERCVTDKQSLPFERALALPAIALTLKNAARAARLKRRA